MPIIMKISEESEYNVLELKKTDVGIIASGIAAGYVKEVITRFGVDKKVSFLKVGISYPIPAKKTAKLLKSVKKLAVIEDGEPFIESQVKTLAQEIGSHATICGKSDQSLLPLPCELTPEIVADAVARFLDIPLKPQNKKRQEMKTHIKELVVPRASTFCAGCPHIGTWWAIRTALKDKKIAGKVPIINGDIGCYELAGYGLFARETKPSYLEESVCYITDNAYELIDTNYIMGGGIGISQGMDHAGYKDGSILAVAGDSTFFHACIPALINTVFNKAKVTFIIFDNSWTAMTGHQPHPGTGKTGTGETTKVVKIDEICKACGIDYVKTVDSYNLKLVTEAVKEALKHPSTAVVVSQRICAHEWLREMRKKKIETELYSIDLNKCTGCKLCTQLGCPALTFDEKRKKAGIEGSLCIGCGLCIQVCPNKAIHKVVRRD
jgi:indolepyruvate ferredoxin oxidoreductase alpha subunit